MNSRTYTRRRTGTTAALLTAAVAGCCVGLFAATPSRAGTYSVLADFPISTTGTLGRKPISAPYVDASGDIFGYTGAGGINNSGVFYELQAGSSTPVALYSAPGYTTIKGLVGGPGGTVFAVATSGDQNNPNAKVISVDPSLTATAATVLYTASISGFAPNADPVVDSAGNLYGTSNAGGTYGYGYVWKLAKGASSPTTIYSFGANALDSATTSGGRYVTLDAQGNIYVTMSQGGANNTGMVAKIAAGTQTETVLYSFGPSTGTDGQQPYTGVSVDSKGNIFGTTIAGGAYGYGTVWKIAAGSTTAQTVYSFGGTNGINFHSNTSERLTIDGADNVFGVASFGFGTASNGGVFEIQAGTSNFQILHTFTGTMDGANPESALALDSIGNLFGTTVQGGCSTNNCGTIFELSGYATPLLLQTSITDAPEPASLALLGTGLTLAGATRRRSRRPA